MLNKRSNLIGPNCSTLEEVCEIKIKSCVLGQFRETQASLTSKPYGLVCGRGRRTLGYIIVHDAVGVMTTFAFESVRSEALAYTASNVESPLALLPC